jgi:MoxR-like ATPase
MSEEQLFEPERIQRRTPHPSLRTSEGGDDRDGRVYVYYEDKIALAVNVALVTRRPLLLSGPSGTGKSTLALNVALSLGWRYYEHVVTSKTEATDFLYRFDTIRRLNDAQANQTLLPTAAYVEPGVLWWAFDRFGAQRRGKVDLPDHLWAPDPCKIDAERAVVLIDEIDKAEVDVPNALLVPFGALQFPVEPITETVKTDTPPLIFITTNGERELPLAFMRRCVVLALKDPHEDQLVEIAGAHIRDAGGHEGLFRAVAKHIIEMGQNGAEKHRLRPSTAEYLDTLRACLKLGIGPDDPRFADLSHITLRKLQEIEGLEE